MNGTAKNGTVGGTCCGTPFHEISVQTAGSTLSLFRCTSCTQQRWTRDGVPLDREAALATLATAYRGVPKQAKAVRDRSAEATHIRRERRLATGAPPVPDPPAKEDLVGLLEGWQVLGATP